MKKLTKPLITLMMTFLLVLSFVPTTFAADKQRVFDNEKIFEQKDIDIFESTAAELNKLFDIDVIFITHSDLDGKTIGEFANDFSKNIDVSKNSVLLTCSFELGKLHIKTGGKSYDAISTADLEQVTDNMTPTLRQDPFGTLQEFYRDIYALHEEAYGLPPELSDDTSSEDTSSEETSSEDTSSEETLSEETLSEDTSSEDTVIDDNADDIAPRSERPHIFDNDVVYDSEDIVIFESLATDMYDKYGVDVIVVNNSDFNGKSAKNYGADFADRDGFLDDNIVLAYSHELGDIAIVTEGKCIDIFTDNDLDYLIDCVTENLRDDPSLATTEFLMKVATYLANDADGIPTTLANGYVTDNGSSDDETLFESYPVLTVVLVIAIPLLIAFVICFIIYRKYTLAGSQYHYPLEDRGSIRLTRKEDIFLREHTSVERIERNDNNSNSGGGSSTFTSSSGDTHGGRSGSF